MLRESKEGLQESQLKSRSLSSKNDWKDSVWPLCVQCIRWWVVKSSINWVKPLNLRKIFDISGHIVSLGGKKKCTKILLVQE